jgi:hypothetical protein
MKKTRLIVGTLEQQLDSEAYTGADMHHGFMRMGICAFEVAVDYNGFNPIFLQPLFCWLLISLKGLFARKYNFCLFDQIQTQYYTF